MPQSIHEQFQNTLVLVVVALLTALMWWFPEEELAAEKQEFYTLWWSAHDTLEVNFLDSSMIWDLPLSESARKAWWYRRTHDWNIKDSSDLSRLPAIDVLWFQVGQSSGKFKYDLPKRPVKEYAKKEWPNRERIQRSQEKDESIAFTSNDHLKNPNSIYLDRVDSASLIAVPGIGPWTAHYIIKEREKWGRIGGAYHLKQISNLGERWKPEWDHLFIYDTTYTTLSINKSELQELYDFPGLNFYQVKRIGFYRETFGFLQWDEMMSWDEFSNMDSNFIKLFVAE